MIGKAKPKKFFVSRSRSDGFLGNWEKNFWKMFLFYFFSKKTPVISLDLPQIIWRVIRSRNARLYIHPAVGRQLILSPGYGVAADDLAAHCSADGRSGQKTVKMDIFTS